MRRVVCLALSVLPLSLLADEPLLWALMPYPGVVNVRDGQLYDGLMVDFLHLLDAQLGDLPVHFAVSNLQRVLNDMGHGRNVCTAPLLASPERDKVGYFVPLLISPPMQVVLRAADVGRLPRLNGPLRFEQLRASALLGGFALQRIYPATLQARLAQEPQLLGVNITANGDRLLLMLNRGRFDYTFEYPMVVAGFARAYPQEAALYSLPLAELAESPIAGSYCTRNDWGRAMSERIDSAARALSAKPQLVEDLYQRWLPAESWQQYSAPIGRFLHARAQQAPLVLAPTAP